MHSSLLGIITSEQESNLLKLAMYLIGLPEQYPDFDMVRYTNDNEGLDLDPAHAACGTAACAAGHGPLIGIEPLPGESWISYCSRVFVDSQQCSTSWAVWMWLFSSSWSKVDNTANGAGRRILYLLAFGLPNDAQGQIAGVRPLCYMPERSKQ